MPGKICDGSTNNPKFKESQSFCDGRAARAAEVSPTNPHTSGTPEADAWDRGVASKVAADPDGCCAPTGPAATP